MLVDWDEFEFNESISGICGRQAITPIGISQEIRDYKPIRVYGVDLRPKMNFFEGRVGEYKKADEGESMEITEDF